MGKASPLALSLRLQLASLGVLGNLYKHPVQMFNIFFKCLGKDDDIIEVK